jgi:hypothetical protein
VTETKAGRDYASIFAGEDCSWAYRSCTGDADGAVFARRIGRVSAVSLEMNLGDTTYDGFGDL